MRITCPDCNAEYEVPDNVIPDAGRDVQCSNCGTTWFFRQLRSSPRQVAEVSEDAPFGAHRGPANDRNGDDAEQTPAPAPRRELDPTVAEILRAEAAREAAARAQEGVPEPLEIQPDLGLRPGIKRQSEERAPPRERSRITPVQETESTEPTRVAETTAEPRRERLPDIEEVNSSLTSDEDGREIARDLKEKGGKRRFRSGFLLAILLFAACFGVYQYSAEIALAMPGADPWLSNYVTWVDELRAEIDAGVAAFMDWFDAKLEAAWE